MRRTLRRDHLRYARLWDAQRARCSNTRNPAFAHYGAKGIRVEYTREEFIRWCIANLPDGYCVGRKDHSKNYALDNIQAETRREGTTERNDRLGNPSRYRNRAVDAIELRTGIVVGEFSSVKAAAERFGMTLSRVLQFCQGKYRRTHAGLTFRYAELPC